MHSIKIAKTNYLLPSKWNEVPEDKVLKVMAHAITGIEGMQRGDSLTRIFRSLVPISSTVWKKLTTDQAWELVQLCSWALEEPDAKARPERWQWAGTTYIMPIERMGNATAIEFSYADTMCQQWLKGKDNNALYKLVAALARPIREDLAAQEQVIDWNGDKRMPFNSHRVEIHAEAFRKSKLSVAIQNAVLRYFIGCKMAIQKTYLFEGGDPPALDLGFLGSMMDLAKSGAFGDFDKVCNTNLHTLFIFIKKNQMEASQK